MNHEEDRKNELIFYFIRLNRMHRTAFDTAARQLGIQRNQHMLLMYLARCGEAVPAQKKLAAELGVTPAAVSGTLDRLESAGLICRSVGEADSRKNEIRLTAQGSAMVEKTHRIFNEVDTAMIGSFSPEELERLARDFSRMTDNLTAWVRGDVGEQDAAGCPSCMRGRAAESAPVTENKDRKSEKKGNRKPQ